MKQPASPQLHVCALQTMPNQDLTQAYQLRGRLWQQKHNLPSRQMWRLSITCNAACQCCGAASSLQCDACHVMWLGQVLACSQIQLNSICVCCKRTTFGRLAQGMSSSLRCLSARSSSAPAALQVAKRMCPADVHEHTMHMDVLMYKRTHACSSSIQ